MKEICLGKVTILINTHMGKIYYMATSEDPVLADYLMSQIETAKKNHPELSLFSFRLVEVKRGCILAGIEIWLSLAAIGASAATINKFIQGYPKTRTGLTKLFEDVGPVKDLKTGEEHNSCIYQNTLPFELEIEKLREEQSAKKQRQSDA